MITLYGKTLADYKKSDPQGAKGYWLDLGLAITLCGGLAATVVVFALVFKELL